MSSGTAVASHIAEELQDRIEAFDDRVGERQVGCGLAKLGDFDGQAGERVARRLGVVLDAQQEVEAVIIFGGQRLAVGDVADRLVDDRRQRVEYLEVLGYGVTPALRSEVGQGHFEQLEKTGLLELDEGNGDRRSGARVSWRYFGFAPRSVLVSGTIAWSSLAAGVSVARRTTTGAVLKIRLAKAIRCPASGVTQSMK